jgi:integrase
MQESTYGTPAVQGGQELSFDHIRGLMSAWTVSRPIAEFIDELNNRYSVKQAAITAANYKEIKRRGKSMSRRAGQSGSLEVSGKWIVVRWWEDVPGQEKRVHKRARVCPITGAGSLSRSAQERRARDIVHDSGADSEEHFEKVVKQERCVTFREQSEFFLEQAAARKWKPVASGTLESWESPLRNWINRLIGDLPISEVNNAVLKRVVAAMVKGGLAPQTIANYTQALKMVVASALNEEGEELYPRKWNHRFADMPRVVNSEQNTPCFLPEFVTALVTYCWKEEWMRVLVILCAATGMRIGEVLGLKIDKHISPDSLTITINQKVRKGKIENRVKTENSRRMVDLHPAIAAVLKVFIGERKSGLLFRSPSGTPLKATDVLSSHLYPALAELGFINQYTGTHKAGFHAFRRYRITHLENRTGCACPRGLQMYWAGHAAATVHERYDKGKEDDKLRKYWAEQCGFGFELPSVVPMVPKTEGDDAISIAA